LQELVEQVSEHGTSIVFSTHILADLERVALDVAFLTHGQLALQAPLDTLLDGTRRVRGASSTLTAWLRALALPVLAQTALDGGRLQVLTRLPPEANQTLPAGLSGESLNLEELFMEFTA
jgi:ABC-2 type transport system ATP-binding protein